MDPIYSGLVGTVALLILLALRVPIGFALIFVSFCGIWFLRDFNVAWSQLGTVPHEFSASWTLSAIPMFILMGAFAQYSGITSRLYDTARLWLVRLPGGLAVATTIACAGFAAASGSSLAMAAAMSKISVPEMLKARYQPALASATVACAGTIGSMIPPSILFILYGWYTETPIGALFIAGVIPGILTAVFYSAMIMIRCRLNPDLAPSLDVRPTMAEKMQSLTKVWPLPVLIVVVLVSLYTGVTTATEAGAFGAFGALVIALLLRSMTLRQFWESQVETVKSLAVILFVVIGAVLLTRFMAMSGLPTLVAGWVASESGHVEVWRVIVFMAVIYLILGMFLDPLGIILITLPIMMPMFEAARMDLVWVGVLVVKLIEIGLLTPPVGLNVYVVKAALDDTVAIGTIFRGVTWFIVCDLLLFALIAAYPGIALWLPGKMG